jgi:hypothetical protein
MQTNDAAEKRHRKLKKESWETNELDFNMLDYDHSMLINLNYYSQEVEPKLKQQWSLDYYKSINKDISGLEKLSASCFNQVGALIRLQQRNVELIETHKRYILNKYNQLRELVPEEIPITKKETSKVEKISEDKTLPLFLELDEQLDNVLFSGTESCNVKKLFLSFKLTSANLKIISSEFSILKLRYQEVLSSSDEEVKESYSNIPKKNIKSAIRFCDEVLESCRSKTKISIRKKKEKPASVIASKVKYQKEFKELKLISISPDKIVSSNEVWLYNTKLRKLFKYKCMDGMALTIKGTTLLNWDSELSGSKTIRKPEEYFKDFQNKNKSSLNKLYSDIKCIIGNPTGRINSDMIILKVF